MSSVGLAPSSATSISQEFAQEQPPNPIPTSASLDTFIGAPVQNPLSSEVPQDTVTLSSALLPPTLPQHQSTKGLPPGAPETSRAAAGRYDLLNAKSNSNPTAVKSALVKADGTPQANLVQVSSPNAQEELQQLDRTLQQLGINPQTVSLIRRVELLRLANDPAALEQYFQSAAGIATQIPSAAAASPPQTQAAGSSSNDSTYAPATGQSPKSAVRGSPLNVSA